MRLHHLVGQSIGPCYTVAELRSLKLRVLYMMLEGVVAYVGIWLVRPQQVNDVVHILRLCTGAHSLRRPLVLGCVCSCL